MRNIFIIAGLIALFAQAQAFAEEPPNLRLITILKEDAFFAMDGVQQSDLKQGSVSLYTLKPGTHFFSVLARKTGDSTRLMANLDADKMSTSHGRRWWCLVVGRRPQDDQLIIALASPPQCDGMLAAAH